MLVMSVVLMISVLMITRRVSPDSVDVFQDSNKLQERVVSMGMEDVYNS